ncbi:multiheme c-type cytochrome [Mangrovibacterium marinum]|uniref:Cytochrome c554/c'-like protein n=1 Tax=Mangrovibacterium marinum TaxID=1639118 RepID=A0A2T5BXR0_9BACT|nr:multiheme c-type cytochrome [Mangrovibacterium marinum]PTN05938.1 cytochrome c554/c'-like protein [Mangrovibacterium marinum]
MHIFITMMEIRKHTFLYRILLFVAVVAVPVYLLIESLGEQAEQEETEVFFTGKETCKECHLAEYRDWEQSHHRRAMDYATEQTVRGDFNGTSLQAQGRTHRFFRESGKFMVNTDGADGQMHDFEVKYVFGYTPLQQYLVGFPGGRLQTLPLAWDAENRKWYHLADHLYADQTIDSNNWLHWTNQAQNWNSMCADCHSTNLVKGYDPQTDSYQTSWSEINVSCEACHGPGSRHLEWASLADEERGRMANFGLQVKTSGIDHQQYVNNCVRCHSRREALQDFDHSSASIYDHLIPNLPEDPTWFIDGQIQDEDYVYASFLQSKMHTKAVRCNNCHNVHSGKLLFGNQGRQYNQLCAQCHQPEIYDTPEHHFHKTEGMPGKGLVSVSGKKFDVGSGSLCINCHMHGRYYMGVDYRRDHSFRIPRPDLSIRYGVPNACNQCHTDKTNEWADDYITQWFGKSRRYHYAEAFAAARREEPGAAQQLKAISGDELYPVNVRALAVQHLGNYFPDSLKAAGDAFLHDGDPTIRLAAVRAVPLATTADIQRLLPMLNDDTKAIRTEAAHLLLAVGEAQIPASYQAAFKQACAEYEQTLMYNADFPGGKFNLGNFYYNQGEIEQAVRYYAKALEQDRELHFVKLNMAYSYNKLGQNGKAAACFADYLTHEPADAAALYSYGLLLAEMGSYEQSLEILLRSYQQDRHRPRVAHNIAMMYDFMGQKKLAADYLIREVELMGDYNSKAELLRFYLSNQMKTKALVLSRGMLAQFPGNGELNELVEQLER